MISFENVTFTYPGTDRPALRQVNLQIPAGALTLVLGPSGSGKSTLLRCLNGLVPHFSGGKLEGMIEVAGLNPVKAGPQVMSTRVGFVFQDPETQFVVDRVEDEIAFALENAAIPLAQMRKRIEQTLSQLNLLALRKRRLETLSGGERQRVAIASALALCPTILALDEPTSQLDPQSAEEVLKTLVRLKYEANLTIILSEHRLERILPFADLLIYMDDDLPADREGQDSTRRQQVTAGLPRKILTQSPLNSPLVTLAKALGWQPLPLTIEEARPFADSMVKISFRKISPDATDQTYDHPTLQPAKLTAEPQRLAPYLRAIQVTYRYGAQVALQDVNLEIYPGEILALMGPNGAGKSTLLRCLVGLLRPTQGHIWLGDEEITTKEVADICLKVGYLPQDPNALLFADTVNEELLITLRNHHLEVDQYSPQADLILLGLAEMGQRYPRDLSTGERQRVALGAITVTRPRLLLLDEPTRGLDAIAKRRLAELLQGWRKEGMAILVVTHDVELAAVIADRVSLLSAGKIIASGSTRNVLGNTPGFIPQIAQLFPGKGWITPGDVIDSYGLSATENLNHHFIPTLQRSV